MHWKGSLCPRVFPNFRINLRTVFSCFKENNYSPCWKHITGVQILLTELNHYPRNQKVLYLQWCSLIIIPFCKTATEAGNPRIKIFFIFFEVVCHSFTAATVCQTGLYYLTLKKRKGFTTRYCIYIWYSRKFLTVSTDKKKCSIILQSKII